MPTEGKEALCALKNRKGGPRLLGQVNPTRVWTGVQSLQKKRNGGLGSACTPESRIKIVEKSQRSPPCGEGRYPWKTQGCDNWLRVGTQGAEEGGKNRLMRSWGVVTLVQGGKKSQGGSTRIGGGVPPPRRSEDRRDEPGEIRTRVCKRRNIERALMESPGAPPKRSQRKKSWQVTGLQMKQGQ